MTKAEKRSTHVGQRTGRVVAACDLDRTLVYSRAAARLGLAEGERTPALECVEVHDGKSISFMTGHAVGLIAELGRRALLVPTTTRTRKQYRRIHLPGPAPAYAICANGGHLLVDGVTDEDWHAGVRKRLDEESAPLAEVVAHLEDVTDPEWTRKLRVAEDLFTYLVLERDRVPAGLVEELTGWAGERGYGVSLQGRKLYFVPEALTKGSAVDEVRRRSGADTVLAAGDSLLDIELLKAADAGIRPGHGELADTDWRAPHVVAIDEVGVRAGETILEWLLGQLDQAEA
ncbi:HAD family hydrolase [Yinghuangia seranimata]|uniref:HAD family hydrolase n=1 Tax=Yinghuangia seranimata TaxID=408067 RepID=UPI00248C8C16|nr:HAD family hydrolase [Yinghuangia seranimata]MDI2129210.1 HAD family hydrolase [Yinghuangia seranimata]